MTWGIDAMRPAAPFDDVSGRVVAVVTATGAMAEGLALDQVLKSVVKAAF